MRRAEQPKLEDVNPEADRILEWNLGGHVERNSVDIEDAKFRLEELLQLAAAGNEVLLTKDHLPVGKLVALPESGLQRVAGLHRGAVSTAQDFNEPLPESFWTDDE